MFYYVNNPNMSKETKNNKTSKAVEIFANEYANNKNIVDISITHAISIGKKSFKNCTNLKEVFLGPDIRKIESEAFANCPALTDLWFPMLDRNASVKIAPDAFKSCGKVCFHVFGLGCSTCGNVDIENYAKVHGFSLMGMI